MDRKDMTAARKRAREIWLASKKKKPLVDIAKDLGVSPRTVSRWKKSDQWVRKQGAPKGNKNGCGHGAPKGSKNGLVTGVEEHIGFGDLTDEENDILAELRDHTALYWTLMQQRDLLIIRQHRMLKRLEALRARKEELIVVSTSTKSAVTTDGKTVPVEAKTDAEAIDDRIIRIERALTEVQAELRRCVDSLRQLDEADGSTIRARLTLFEAIASEGADIDAD